MPPNTTPKEELALAAFGHHKGIEAILFHPKPDGIQLKTEEDGITVIASQSHIIIVILLSVSTMGLAFIKWATWGLELENGVIFHGLIWCLLAVSAYMFVIFLFSKLRMRFRQNDLQIANLTLGRGRNIPIDWHDIKAIAKGAMVNRIADSFGRRGKIIPLHRQFEVISLIKLKTVHGVLSFGGDLTPEHRVYIRQMLMAYWVARRAAIHAELQQRKE